MSDSCSVKNLFHIIKSSRISVINEIDLSNMFVLLFCATCTDFAVYCIKWEYCHVYGACVTCNNWFWLDE